MAHSKRNPGAGGARARKAFDQLVTAINSELTPLHNALQIQRLATRFGLTIATARVVAELAFSHGRAAR